MIGERRNKSCSGSGQLMDDTSRAQNWFVLAVEVVGKPTAVMTYFMSLFYIFLVSTDVIESFVVDGRPRSSTKFCNIMAAFMFAAMTLFLITVVENWTVRISDKSHIFRNKDNANAVGDGCFVLSQQ